MKVTGLTTSRLYNLKITDYLVDWDSEKLVSKPQTAVRDFLSYYWKGHVVGTEVRIPASRLRCDFINFTRHIVVEVSPGSSHSYNKFFHKDRFRFGAAVMRDLRKQEWAERNGFKYIALDDDDIGNLSKQLFKERGIEL